MWKFVILATSIAAGVDVEITSLDGDVSSGTIQSLTDQEVIIATAEGEQKTPIEDLKALTPKDASITPVKEAATIKLRGGSAIRASSFTVTKNRAAVKVAGSDESLDLSTRHLHSVRLIDGGEKANAQWREILAEEIAGDAIVLKKANDQGEIRLDYLEGVLLDVGAEKLTFEYDGDEIPVSLSKVYGVIYYSARRDELPRAVCQIADRYGSRWNARELKVNDTGIAFTSSSGLEQTMSWESLGQVDFSTGNVVYLSDIEFLSFKWTPYISSQFSDELSKLFRPMLNNSFNGKFLKVGGKTFRKGLALRSRTKIEYKLPEEVTKFVAVIGVDDRAVRSGAVEVSVYADGEAIYTTTVTGETEPIPLLLDISNRRRFAIIVDFGDDADIADQINLCNARFTK